MVPVYRLVQIRVLQTSGNGANNSQISGLVIHSSPNQGIFVNSTNTVTIIGKLYRH